ncbi:hypothetical protein [Limihaloglobus sulfuriphilus]|uniref:hypothetical protein n=1 Tax=Limihaloglobus sulfuriphilus TaxID=1851148 RepID=UPI0011BAD283|nr:hypothetical protein [Limihaloglobus sulfuriphilus]
MSYLVRVNALACKTPRLSGTPLKKGEFNMCRAGSPTYDEFKKLRFSQYRMTQSEPFFTCSHSDNIDKQVKKYGAVRLDKCRGVEQIHEFAQFKKLRAKSNQIDMINKICIYHEEHEGHEERYNKKSILSIL